MKNIMKNKDKVSIMQSTFRYLIKDKPHEIIAIVDSAVTQYCTDKTSNKNRHNIEKDTQFAKALN
ncbi:MAG: hypothetical protein QNK11_05230 [Legionella sp.]|nr:hypothetical protein [Legionella sp.]